LNVLRRELLLRHANIVNFERCSCPEVGENKEENVGCFEDLLGPGGK
jgi:hypothetical protein